MRNHTDVNPPNVLAPESWLNLITWYLLLADDQIAFIPSEDVEPFHDKIYE